MGDGRICILAIRRVGMLLQTPLSTMRRTNSPSPRCTTSPNPRLQPRSSDTGIEARKQDWYPSQPKQATSPPRLQPFEMSGTWEDMRRKPSGVQCFLDASMSILRPSSSIRRSPVRGVKAGCLTVLFSLV